MLARVERGVGLLVGAAAALGGVALLLIVGVVMVDVVGRYFGRPLYGSRDLVQMSAVFVIFGGMAFAERRGGHIQVDILKEAFPPRVNRALTVLGYVVGAVVFALIAWTVWKASGMSKMLNMSTNLLRLPRAPFEMAVAALSAVMAVLMGLRAVTAAIGRTPA